MSQEDGDDDLRFGCSVVLGSKLQSLEVLASKEDGAFQVQLEAVGRSSAEK